MKLALREENRNNKKKFLITGLHRVTHGTHTITPRRLLHCSSILRAEEAERRSARE